MTTTENEQRDELIDAIWGKEFPYGGAGASIRIDANAATAVAEAILAAGFRKPRTITTVEELDALHHGSVVACISQVLNLPVTFVFQRGSHNGPGWGWSTPDTPGQIESADVFEYIALNGFPTTFTVLWEPDFGAQPTNIDFAVATAKAVGVPLTEQQVRDYAQRDEPEAEVGA